MICESMYLIGEHHRLLAYGSICHCNINGQNLALPNNLLTASDCFFTFLVFTSPKMLLTSQKIHNNHGTC